MWPGSAPVDAASVVAVRRMLWLVPVVAVFVVGGVGLFRARPAAELGKPAPDITLPALDGNGDIRLAGFSGKPVVVNFWASWCDPCEDEAPEFARVAREFGEDVHFLGITMLDGKEDAVDFMRRYDIPYPSARDTRGVVAKRYGVTGVPETAFIDADGNLVGNYIGAFTEGQLEDVVRDLIELRPGALLQLTGRGETRPVP
jgi:cytochrome c biogenesis protein CcmG, thiol:disulfide interchange protein DsbE